MNQDLFETYSEIWSRGKQAILSNKLSLDPFLKDLDNDKRLGISTNFPMQGPALSQMLAFMETMRKMEPDQFYYSPKSLHITLYDPIASHEGFIAEPDLIKRIQTILDHELHDQRPITFHLQGITASPGAIMFQGFCDDDLQELRIRIRNRIIKDHIPIKERIFLDIAHSTAVRFINELHDPHQLAAFIEKNRDTDFGMFHADKVHFLISDWYSLTDKKRILKEFTLKR